MFRRKKTGRNPVEIEFPHDLKELGLFINEKDQLRQIEKPNEGFDYFAHGRHHGYMYAANGGHGVSRERLNERRREAVDACLRSIVITRLEGLGLTKLLLPLGASAEEPHVPIMVSQNLQTCDKVLVFSPDSNSGALGIWCMRSIEEGALNDGSMIDAVKRALESGYGVVIMNAGQLLWDYTTKSPMGFGTWRATKDKKTPINAFKNTAPSNRDPEEHVSYVFKHILDKVVPSHAEIDIMACGMAAYYIVMFLNNNWDNWKCRVFALVMAESTHCLSNITNIELQQFLMQRARNYIVHSKPRESVILDPRFGCATFSSSAKWPSAIVPSCLDLFMGYLNKAHADPENCNPDVPVIVGDVPDHDEWMNAMKNVDQNTALHVLDSDSFSESTQEGTAAEA
ncbi:unnamed protein product [Tuber melanosporum]|uniref:(Perigord truffle) hypothetical protein n=1 Tax=Tuber melanosporum (strain Mel28) TaxID=656061 RepID=D5G7U6_TUBMM|nr:uncharacterized protein GSTUM_00002657001 [Tuber melanosporum]CAZ80589.1 unnamed protein product [Tuber melanosporum]